MICEEERVDLRLQDPKSIEEGKRLTQLAFRLNHTMLLWLVILQE